MTTVPDLECDHEEADTSMILHAKHAQTNKRTIWSPDTDVAVIALANSSVLQAQCQSLKLLFTTGRKDKARTLDLTVMSGH